MPTKKMCRHQPGILFERCISASESIIFADISEPFFSGWVSRTGRNSYTQYAPIIHIFLPFLLFLESLRACY